ncbi:TIGR03619 family F420-dependent LLM class oxidoreductase [Amycolatopsis acidiphila]|uniref:TIGR03619 family F420-dependent LLM class oxidoreductase n=1 Tax=Amycolatopsis acidiphila TaxID=715473 RepID=A0A558AB01_9PSEU|nr:TIGR03619 family F420-dependent LLM class oxidoreductase [Amycolatopsis acidiphila]TVT21451.1 TIGR03619 family F420-dependent LLM class oxidoreductase [Amycolatopsis acidiphila]UIJ63128.1 TIGR03619 family F420-dependent LLM class oxidoreductase [Amycolatopsis acidiphila]GHG73889.1 LLM class F420-dependent oxidoreductase [Amycolatopsis acidiphila]
MRFTVEHPVGRPGCVPALYSPAGPAAFARAAEEAGFDAVAFTEHPAPSAKWYRAGGHATLDPLAALAFCAAATERIRLLTYLLVLPYYNPLALAKTVATVDLLSAGRLVLGAGGGYLRSEFTAVGAGFAERGELFDEALGVLRSVWATEEFSFAGRGFTAHGQVSTPAPVQRPCPPVWIGGNGRVARRRVARAGQGWAPLLIGEELAATTRTTPLETVAELAAAIRELAGLAEAQGRDPAGIDVQVQSAQSDLSEQGAPAAGHDGHLAELAVAGVTWFVVRTPATSLEAATDALARYGADVISRHRTDPPTEGRKR